MGELMPVFSVDCFGASWARWLYAAQLTRGDRRIGVDAIIDVAHTEGSEFPGEHFLQILPLEAQIRYQLP